MFIVKKNGTRTGAPQHIVETRRGASLHNTGVRFLLIGNKPPTPLYKEVKNLLNAIRLIDTMT